MKKKVNRWFEAFVIIENRDKVFVKASSQSEAERMITEGFGEVIWPDGEPWGEPYVDSIRLKNPPRKLLKEHNG